MKTIQKKMLVQVLLGFLLGRVSIYGMNPVAPAFFAAGFAEGGAVLPVAITILLGMSTVFALDTVLAYGAGMLALWLAADFLKRRRITVKMGHAAFLLAAATWVMSGTRYLLVPYSGTSIFLATLEAVLMLAVTRIFHGGIVYLLHGTRESRPGKEEVISLGVLAGAALWGFPRESFTKLSLTEIMIWILLAFTGYLVGLYLHPMESGNEWKELMKHRLHEFSDSFQKLSKALANQSDKQFRMTRHEMREFMDGISEQVCDRCENRENCMGQLELASSEMFGTLLLAQEQGILVPEQMPARFLRECIHLERFVSETNQNLQMARMMMGVQNKMSENRQVIAGQMEEVGKLVGGLAEEMERTRDLPADAAGKVGKKLQAKRVKALGIMFYEKRDGRLEIHMRARTVRGRLVTAKEVAAVLQEVLQKPIRVGEQSRQIVSRDMTYFVFEEDTPLVAEAGVSRRVKDGEEVSGDVFTCLPLPSGEMLIALSDGMGSGQDAFSESSLVIELLEQMAEAGFSQTSALKLINSVYLSCEETECYVTADILVLNLYKKHCQLLKNGATATYLYHEGEITCVEGQALPIGAGKDVIPYTRKMDISAGDYVIMMTDGVADMLPGMEHGLAGFMEQWQGRPPEEIADALLEEAICECGGSVPDDMSVIVTEISDNLRTQK
ncbi:MAG: hypothetical protein BHW05_02675 [Clostridium sp. 42_12]|nr:MAG: hypothetical protein BHW05_02675 [Clostridium sp. 42_12]